MRRLVGFARVELAAGAAARVSFRLHADRASFTGRDLRRVVEAGEVALAVGASSEDLRLRATVHLTGPDRVVGVERVLTTPVTVEPLG
ncbi:fibronectin type III-like domain-contianing protein [Geodermatophilus amargosae]|uniref:fibronectin type III-like domain-contianing protein n=1 Tax=Geodermatophilus amargosae TaxID=1296565 RepID=UPI0034DF2232